MAAVLLLLLFLTSSLLIPSYTEKQNLQSTDQEAFISLLVSEHGLDFIKNLIINESTSTTSPLNLVNVKRTTKIPFLGSLEIVVFNMTINKMDVLSSYVKPGDKGVAIDASGTTFNISMSWHFKFITWLVPLQIFHQGTASFQVAGLQVGLKLGLENQKGSLKFSLEDSGFHVKRISLNFNIGGRRASQLYQGVIDTIGDKIDAVVEDVITKQFQQGIQKVDSFLQALPNEIPIDDNASFNISFVKDPSLTNSSIRFDINGLFIGRSNTSSFPMNRFKSYSHSSSSSVFCSNPSNMLGLSVDEAVFNSGSPLLYDAKFMRLVVDKIPDHQKLLNTAGWRFIVPTLYRKYPNADMNINISLSSPPVIKFSESDISANAYVDIIIDVLRGWQVIPVACLSLDVRGSGSVSIIAGNKIGGKVKVSDFTLSLKWSNIGNLRLDFIQPVVWSVIRTVVIPRANVYLEKGILLPSINGFSFKNGEIICSGSKIVVCGDVDYIEPEHNNQLLSY